MHTSLSSPSSFFPTNLDSVFQVLKKSHPHFVPQFSTDDWVENSSIWSLSEAAIQNALEVYRKTLGEVNSGIERKIVSWETEIKNLEQELTTLSVWNKERRKEITDKVGQLKSEHKITKSETVQAQLDGQIRTLETELSSMANDRERRRAVEEKIAQIRLSTQKLSENKISTSEQDSLVADLLGFLSELEVKNTPKSAPVQTPSPKTPFLSSTPGKVATILVGLGIGTGIAWWNVVDQINKGKKPVNAIERLIQGDEKNTQKIMDISTLKGAIQSAMDDVEFKGGWPHDALGDTPTNNKLCQIMIEAVNTKIPPYMQQYIGGISVGANEMKFRYPSPGVIEEGLVFRLDTIHGGLHFETVKWLKSVK